MANGQFIAMRGTMASQTLIPMSFANNFRAKGYRMLDAPEDLPIVEAPTLLSEVATASKSGKQKGTGETVRAENPPPGVEALAVTSIPDAVYECDCGKVCKNAHGLRVHRARMHPDA